MTNIELQKTDFEWFCENEKQLYQEYGKCFLAIKNKTVLGSFVSFAEAVTTVSKTEEVGTFIVQECSDDPSANTNTIMTIDLCLV